MATPSKLYPSLSSDDDDEHYENASTDPIDTKSPHKNINKLIEEQLKIDSGGDDDEDEDDDQFVDVGNAPATDTASLDDDATRRDYEKTLSPEALLANKAEANELKTIGNEQFKGELYSDAIDSYTNGLKLCPLNFTEDRSVLFGNRAAAHIQLTNKTMAIEDCCRALELNAAYVKVLIRFVFFLFVENIGF